MKIIRMAGLFLTIVILVAITAACSNTTSITSTTPPVSSSTSAQVATTSTINQTVPALTSSSTITQANWWTSLGTPQYGGTITYARASILPDLDPSNTVGGIYQLYMESLWIPSWTVNRNTWPCSTVFLPEEDSSGLLAQSWEMTDPQTLIVHLRQGIKWQNKPPVNGREFTADDVEQHYDRILGNGSGYTTPSPYYASRLALLDKVTALDKYTVQFKFKSAAVQWFSILSIANGSSNFEAPEEVNPALIKASGGANTNSLPISDWHNAVGTGPWMLTDYVDGSSVTLTKNPNYWYHDERYPQNQLPYANQLIVSIIPDVATRIAALRTGKVDYVDAIDLQTSQTLATSDPELKQGQIPAGMQTADLVVTHAPFNDLNVRKAMDLAINRDQIAQTYYKGTVSGTPSGLPNRVLANAGYGFAYTNWPQSLKDEYSYNPNMAKQLLAQAGYPNGFTTTMQAPSVADTDLMQIFKSEWADIGVKVNIQTYDLPSYNALAFAGKLDNIGWDFMGQRGVTTTPASAITFYAATNPNNFGQVNDPTYTSLINQFSAATTMAQAKQIFQQADQYIISQHWSIGACSTYSYNIWQPYLKGYSGEMIGSQGSVSFPYIFSRLWIDQAAKTAAGH